MTSAIRQFWGPRSPRERIMIGLMVALAGAILVWFLVLRPVAEARHAAAETRKAAAEALGETRLHAREIARLRQGLPAGRGAMRALSASAAAAGLSPSVAEERDGAARFVFDSVRPQVFFAWVSAVETRGVPVQRLSSSPNGEGALRAEVVFRRPER